VARDFLRQRLQAVKMATHSSSCSPPPLHEAPNHKVLEVEEHGRILCLADVRGRLSTLNELAQDTGAVAIIHTGDFGFFGITGLGIYFSHLTDVRFSDCCL